MSKMRAGFSRQIKVIVIMALLAVTGAILSVFWLTRRHAANAHVEVPGIDEQGGVLVAAWDHPPQSQKILGIQTLESTAERENAPPAAHGPAGRSTTSA